MEKLRSCVRVAKIVDDPKFLVPRGIEAKKKTGHHYTSHDTETTVVGLGCLILKHNWSDPISFFVSRLTITRRRFIFNLVDLGHVAVIWTGIGDWTHTLD